MKTKYTILCGLLFLFFVAGVHVYAEISPEGPTNFLGSPVETFSQPMTILLSAIAWIYTIFFIVAVLFLLIAAYHFILGGQSEDHVKKAKAQIKYAIIAIVVALVASGISVAIEWFLGTGGLV